MNTNARGRLGVTSAGQGNLAGTLTDLEAWQLVERAQAGDVDAFGDIYRRYRTDVYRFVNHKIRNPETADDLTQETFVRAWKSVGSVTWQGRNPVAWLITIARNLVFDHCKSAAVRMSTPVAEMLGADDPDREPLPDEQVITAAARAAVRAAIEHLQGDQKTVIELRYLQDLTVAETAAAMGKNDGAIKALAYRAGFNLRALLDERFGTVAEVAREKHRKPVPLPRRAA